MIVNITGMAGAGKTTLANFLSKMLGHPIVSIADCRRRALKKTADMFEAELLAWDLFRKRMLDLDRRKKSYILDSSGYNGRLIAIFSERGYRDVFTIKLVCDLENALKRGRGETRQKLFSEVYGFGSYKDFVFLSKKLSEKAFADLTIDTSRNGKVRTLFKALIGFLIWGVI